MALSDEERRRLEMLEQSLASSDPDLNRKLQSGAPGKHHREGASLVRAVLTLLAAFALVIVGIATELIIVGAIGFLLMIAGAHWFLNGNRVQDGSEEPPTPQG